MRFVYAINGRPLAVLFAAAIFATFFAHYFLGFTLLGGIDAQRVAVMAFSCLSAFFLLLKLSYRLVFLFFAVLFFTLLFKGFFMMNGYIKHISYLLMLLPLLTVFYVLGATVGGRFWEVGISLCCIFSMILVFVCAVAFKNSGVDFSWKEVFSYASHARFVNHFQVGIVLLLAFSVAEGSGWRRALYFFALCALVFVVIVTAGRGIWLSMLAGVAALYVLIEFAAFRRILICLLGGGLLGFLLFEAFDRLFFEQKDMVGLSARANVLVDNRTAIWSATVNAIFERPFLGYGAYSFAKGEGLPPSLPAHPHQHFLQVAYEYGLPLAVSLYALLVAFVVSLGKKIKKSRDVYSAVLLASFVAIVVNAQYSAVFTMPVGQVVGVILTGLLLGRYSQVPLLGYSGISRDRRVSLLISSMSFLVALSCAYWLATVDDYYRGLMGEEFELNFWHEKSRYLPRTWENAS